MTGMGSKLSIGVFKFSKGKISPAKKGLNKEFLYIKAY